jgi:hypothetical protein
MRTSGNAGGTANKRSTFTSLHPHVVYAAESVGRLARITRANGTAPRSLRAILVAEKSIFGWVMRSSRHRRNDASGRRTARGRHAFTRLELCACVVAGALLMALALPALATVQSRAHVAQCLNNLRLMGRGTQAWAADFKNEVPWRTHVADGGTQYGPKSANAWIEYYAMSNHLGTPRILACPADEGVRVASTYGEFVAPGFQANCSSYALDLDVRLERPEAILYSDRNLKFSGGPTLCSSGVNNAMAFDSQGAWLSDVHGLSGNIVTAAGNASHTSSEQLRAAASLSTDVQNTHFLKAR